MSTPIQSSRIVLHASILAALAVSCGGTESTAASGAPKPAAAEAPLLPANVEPVPTAEEAAKEADATIDDANADAELEKLKGELGGG